MNHKRPVNLDISTIKLPVTAKVSILHRVSGVILVAAVAVLMWMLDTSLESAEGFASISEIFSSTPAKMLLWACLAALAYHLVAGLRHLLMDMGIGESLEGGKRGAVLVFVIALVLIVLAGVWVW